MAHDIRTIDLLAAGAFDQALAALYPNRDTAGCRARYIQAAQQFAALFGKEPVVLISAPGRAEIGGNHTDHQRGRVLAAAVDLDVLCVAAPNGQGVIRVCSEGHPPAEVTLDDLRPQAVEQGHSAALVRGVAEWFRLRGHAVGGFDAYTVSEVPGGSGLSSSAAFEVAVGNLLAALYGGDVTPADIALAGQYAENRHFGKPCGLMDQMVSSVGGLVQIDFSQPEAPDVRPVPLTALSGLGLCITNTGGSHADLTPAYAAIPEEMGRVAALFGASTLREVPKGDFYQALPRVRAQAGDRAALRAMHFFADNALVARQAEALSQGDTAGFLDMVVRSGRSSLAYLQNVFDSSRPREQGLCLALAVSERLLDGRGAWRVHGGGFAGTIEAFVPDALLPAYRAEMDALFGPGACRTLPLRAAGGVRIRPRQNQTI
ncbi:MAG: galactokinase [Oscillospiraceae bacterium]|nr:galactokinase [Oscillospiraceae bacterium]